jgi:hypothetical protein
MPQEEGDYSGVAVLVGFWSCTMLFYKMVMLEV